MSSPEETCGGETKTYNLRCKVFASKLCRIISTTLVRACETEESDWRKKCTTYGRRFLFRQALFRQFLFRPVQLEAYNAYTTVHTVSFDMEFPPIRRTPDNADCGRGTSSSNLSIMMSLAHSCYDAVGAVNKTFISRQIVPTFLNNSTNVDN